MNINRTTLPFIISYGERGIVNSIVRHVAEQPNPSETTGKLLDAVQWADAGKPAWISKSADANLVVEVGLGQFGDPDLMIVCWTEGDDRPYCVFLEAKPKGYRSSMGSNSDGMSADRFNSTINGQISLKYRFARALGNPKSSEDEIVESERLFAAYKTQLRDNNPGPRHLKKAQILQIFNDLGLMSLGEDRCYYVALTWDNADHVFFKDSAVKPDNLPLMLDEAGKDVYDTVKPRLGWLGYRYLEEALDLHASDEYAQACCGMFSQPEPTEKDYRTRGKPAVMPKLDKGFRDNLFGRFKEACDPNAEPSLSPCTVSYTLLVAGERLAKIVPSREGGRVFVGVRDPGTGSSSHMKYMKLPEEYKGNKSVLFRGTELKPDIDSIAADLHMVDILEVFKELAAQTSR